MHGMANRIAWLLLNDSHRRATGEELGLDFWPMDFPEAFGPATLDALKAVGHRKAMAWILIDLYGSRGEPETLAELLEASAAEGSDAMRAAFLWTVRESGSMSIEPFRKALPGEHHAACYLFEGIRAEINAMNDCPERLDRVGRAISGVLDATDDPDVVDALDNALCAARQQDGAATVAALLDGCAEALLAADDPWFLLGALVDGLRVSPGWVMNGEAIGERFWRHFEKEVASEGPERLWDGYRWGLSRQCAVDREDALALASAYRRAVRAVTDPHWIADRLLEVCSGSAYDCGRSRYWLPDRDGAVLACVNTIRAVRGPRSANSILLRGVLEDPEEAVDSLLDATREAVRTADDSVEAVEVLVDGLSVAEPEWPPSWWE